MSYIYNNIDGTDNSYTLLSTYTQPVISITRGTLYINVACNLPTAGNYSIVITASTNRASNAAYRECSITYTTPAASMVNASIISRSDAHELTSTASGNALVYRERVYNINATDTGSILFKIGQYYNGGENTIDFPFAVNTTLFYIN